MSNEYWSIAVDTICDETGASFTKEQEAKVIHVLERFHQDYGDQHGHREADKSVRRMNDDAARNAVFRFIEEQMEQLDCGPNFFDRLSRRQKEALANLQMARQEFMRRAGQ
jgi:hypothetical protein